MFRDDKYFCQTPNKNKKKKIFLNDTKEKNQQRNQTKFITSKSEQQQ